MTEREAIEDSWELDGLDFDESRSVETGANGKLSENSLRTGPASNGHTGAIDTAAWQRTLNDALENKNFELIKTLQRVLPDTGPDSEIVRARLNELFQQRPNGWEKEVKSISEISSVRPDSNLVQAELKTLLDKFGVETNIKSDLSSVVRLGQVQVTEAQACAKYEALAFEHALGHSRTTLSDHFQGLREISSIAPPDTLVSRAIATGDLKLAQKIAALCSAELTAEQIQECYRVSLDESGYIYIPDGIKEKPGPDLVQGQYEQILVRRCNGWIELIKRLHMESGIAPQFTQEQVDPVFQAYLDGNQYGRGDWDDIERVIELTGLQPPEAMIASKALHIVASGGRQVAERLETLENGIGRKITVSQSEIQDRYRKAISENKSQELTRLFRAFKLAPAVSESEARSFMLGQVPETHCNSVSELEEIFGVQLNAGPEEVAALYDEAFEKSSFDRITKISEVTGISPDVDRLRSAIEKYALDEIAREPGMYGSRWPRGTKNLLKRFELSVSDTFVRSLYESCVAEGRIALTAIKGINEVSDGTLPEDLAQRAYQVLATAEGVKTGSSWTQTGDGKEVETVNRPSGSMFETVSELSGGTKPALDDSVVQDYYTVCITAKSHYHRDTPQPDSSSIEKVQRLTGIEPNFDQQKIQALCRECVIHGHSRALTTIVKVTNVEFSVDSDPELPDFVRRKIRMDLEAFVTSENRVDTNALSSTKAQIEATGVSVTLADLRDIYSRTLALEKDWAEKLRAIVEATGVQPSFSEVELTDKATAVAESGKFFGWSDLRNYGYEPDVALIQGIYQSTLNVEFDGDGYIKFGNTYYETKSTYCLDAAQRLYEGTGVLPSNNQLANLAGQLVKSYQRSRHTRESLVVRSVNALREAFELEPDQAFVDCFSTDLLNRGLSQWIPDLATETGLTPVVNTTEVARAADQLVESGDMKAVEALSENLGLDHCPVTPDAVQQGYRTIVTGDSFAKDRSSIEQLFQLQAATRVQPSLEQREVDLAYRKLSLDDWKRFEEFSGKAPSNEVIQGGYAKALDSWDRERSIAKVHEVTGVALSQEVVDRVGDQYARKADLGAIKKLAEDTGIQPNISNEAALVGYENAVARLEEGNRIAIGKIFFETSEYFETTCDVQPSRELLTRIFCATVGRSDYEHAYKDTDGKRQYPKAWEHLTKRYGAPDPIMTQSIYADLMLAGDLHPCTLVQRMNEVYGIIGVKPSLPQMVEAPALADRVLTESSLRTRLQGVYQECVLGRNIEAASSLVELTGEPYQPDPNNLQILYSQVLMSDSDKGAEVVQFLVSSTGTPPDDQIVQARYRELFRKYVETCHSDYGYDDDESYEDFGESFLGKIEELENGTHVTPVFDREFALDCYKHCIVAGEKYYDKLKTINEYHTLSLDDRREAVTTGIVELLQKDEKAAYDRYFTPEHGFFDQLNSNDFPPCLRTVLVNFELTTPAAFGSFLTEEPEFGAYIARSPDTPTLATLDDRAAVKRLHISLRDAEELYRAEIDVQRLAEGQDFEGLFDALSSHSEAWQDSQNISGPFQRGAEVFGYREMFRYVEGENLHDALHAFDRIIELHQTSGLEAQQFNTQILQQVHRDGARYDEGSACNHLNMIAQTLDLNIEDTLGRARGYDLERLNQLVEGFDSSSAVFSSWRHLRRYRELSQFLERAELLDELKELRETGNEKLYHWIETLAFHEGSNVSIQDVMRFWRDPSSFLDVDDEHTPTEVHNRKKPINYVDIPNLDLTAEELRDALVEGALDRLQAFPPMEIVYQIPKIPTREALRQALGSRDDEVPGKAKDRGKLFQKTRGILGSEGVDVKAYLDGQNVSPETEERLLEVITDDRWGMAVDTVTLRAKVNLKSDPDGVLAGNDTACCMPFGSGKNNVYTYNPVTALFTVQLQRPDRAFRTIAQSVLTEDQDIKTSVAEVIGKLERTDVHLTDILPEEVLMEAPSYLACDNVEVARNYKQSRYEKLIETVYGDFFREYLNRFGEQKNLSRNFIPVGQGYSDTLTHLPEEPNTFAPKAPVSYSDKTGANVYRLDIPEARISCLREVSIPEVESDRSSAAISVRGVEPLTYSDTIAISYLEGKAYRDNEALIVGLHNIENTLIASGINNELKGRPNLSAKYVQNGRVKGYVVAYEGRLRQDDYDEDGDSGDKPVVYVADMAAEEGSTLAGGKLVQAFSALYVENYLQKGNLVPIYAQFREQTSYRLLQRKLDQLAGQAGVEMDVEEVESYQEGGDTMHVVLITPRSTTTVSVHGEKLEFV